MSKSQEFQKGYDRGVQGEGPTTWTEDTLIRPPQGEDKAKRNLDMSLPAQRRMRLSGGTELAYVTAGDPSNPALLLLHGFPSSARTFRDVIPGLARAAYVIAPDLPGYGQSDVLPSASFAAFSDAISELLDHLAIKRRFIYLHDSGAAVGLPLGIQLV